MSKVITFILPRTGELPIGGFKVVYEYANRLVKDGFKVNIVYGITSRPVSNIIIRYGYYFCRWFRWLSYKYFKNYKPNWFNIDKNVKHILCYHLDKKSIPDTDFLFATSWSTAYWVDLYDKIPSSRKYYFIQSFEDWNGDYDFVVKTWKMDMNKIVIAPWLEDLGHQFGEDVQLVENGFDQTKFYTTIPIEEKNKYSVVMLWHDHPLKACDIGLKSLLLVKEKYPMLKVTFFGVPSRPDSLPDWIEYHQTPKSDLHLQIYNSSAIFLGPSSKEGFCLTPPEAMLCGCAVVCSDIGGYTVVAKDNETALLTPVGDYTKFASNIICLIENDELRYSLARKGRSLVQEYTWERAYSRLKKAMNLV